MAATTDIGGSLPLAAQVALSSHALPDAAHSCVAFRRSRLVR
jgi:hypothetical protein